MQKVKMRSLAGKGTLKEERTTLGHLTGGCMYLMKGSSTGDACKYGAKIIVCLGR